MSLLSKINEHIVLAKNLEALSAIDKAGLSKSLESMISVEMRSFVLALLVAKSSKSWRAIENLISILDEEYNLELEESKK